MNNTFSLGQVIAVLGCQWGDEGKGKLVDMLAEKYDIIVRSAGGANAGHTIYVKLKTKNEEEEIKKVVFRLVPSGILHEHTTCIIGNGCVVHLPSLFEEIDQLGSLGIEAKGRLFLSDRAHLLFDYHKIIDGIQEEHKAQGKVGTTKRGIGPAYADKINRIGIRAGDLKFFDDFSEKFRTNVTLLKKMYGGFDYDVDKELNLYREYAEKISDFISDSVFYLHDGYKKGKNILLEGANGLMLDIDLGTYPFVTSSNPSTGGLFTGSGLPTRALTDTLGIVKAYTTRVGGGPFPTELTDELGEKIRQTGGEFGSVTGRPRRCGWIDIVQLKYALMINGITSINLTKLDVLSGLKTLKVGLNYRLNGKNLTTMPSTITEFSELTVDYLELPGFEEDISAAKTFAELPKNAQSYVLKLEELLEIPIRFVGVGQRRDQMIVR